MTTQEQAAWYRQKIEEALERALPAPREGDLSGKVREAMRYSLLSGGKRIRPILALAFCEACGGEALSALPFACAVEMIHTYSLIHDDMPCMDDDDLRRGRPTVHKAFGEGTAVLAGDALLNMAFEHVEGRAARYIARESGMRGMVGGQCLDLANSGGAGVDGAAWLDKINSLKTSALFRAALVGGAIAAGADEKLCHSLENYAEELGKVFQIVDDLLDALADESVLGKSAGQDAKNGKVTYVSLLGVEGAKARAEELNENCKSALLPYGERAEKLISLADELIKRVK